MIPISFRLSPPTNMMIKSVAITQIEVERSGSATISPTGTAKNTASFASTFGVLRFS